MIISINKIENEEIINKITEDYKNGKSLRQIEKDYKINRQTVSKFLEKNWNKNN